MAKLGSEPANTSRRHRSLMVRLDDESKDYLARAAQLRRISVSDYVRTVTVEQARREVVAARDQTIALTPAEQLAFWKALNEPAKLTAAQRRLAKVMRGES
jgi:uncharacterized protein (DUF1778 family)